MGLTKGSAEFGQCVLKLMDDWASKGEKKLGTPFVIYKAFIKVLINTFVLYNTL
jgi:hypothetical protein